MEASNSSSIHTTEKEANEAMVWRSMVEEVVGGTRRPGSSDEPADVRRMAEHARRIHAADSSFNRLNAVDATGVKEQQ